MIVLVNGISNDKAQKCKCKHDYTENLVKIHDEMETSLPSSSPMRTSLKGRCGIILDSSYA